MSSILKNLRMTMTGEKKSEAKHDLFAFYVGRPVSYVLTVPFLKLGVSPTAVTKISIVIVWAAFLILSFAENKLMAVIGSLLFVLWNLLDGVDGNIARLKKTTSLLGTVWDATSGYFAMFLLFASVGFYAGTIDEHFGFIFYVLGSLSGMFQIFPRLVMQKAANTLIKGSHVGDKKSFGFIKVIGLNLTSVTGFPQPLLVIALLLGLSQIYTIGYFFINLLFMVLSLREILNGN